MESVDGQVINSWNSFKNQLMVESKGGRVAENGWPKVPLSINNEEIVGLKENLIEGFRGCENQGDVFSFNSILMLEDGDSRL